MNRRRERRPPDALVAAGVLGVATGAALFIAASWVLHCRFDMGPWSCQANRGCRSPDECEH